jgi:hypothetical protein
VVPAAESKLGERGRMPRPFVVVVSGKTQMILVGYCSVSSLRVKSLAPGGGESCGAENAT